MQCGDGDSQGMARSAVSDPAPRPLRFPGGTPHGAVTVSVERCNACATRIPVRRAMLKRRGGGDTSFEVPSGEAFARSSSFGSATEVSDQRRKCICEE
jgi:hypothetical protein